MWSELQNIVCAGVYACLYAKYKIWGIFLWL
jgi:hypothetical protein